MHTGNFSDLSSLICLKKKKKSWFTSSLGPFYLQVVSSTRWYLTASRGKQALPEPCSVVPLFLCACIFSGRTRSGQAAFSQRTRKPAEPEPAGLAKLVLSFRIQAEPPHHLHFPQIPGFSQSQRVNPHGDY